MNVGFVFGIILAIIIIGFLLFFGIKYIGEWSEMACESQMGQQITNLKNAVKSTLALSQGGSQELRITIPSCFEKICFVDPDHPEDYPPGGWEPETHVRIIVVNEKNSVVICRPSGVVEGYKIDKFKPYVNFCMTSTKTVILRNTGTLVEITLPEF
ncbi:MAG: hypothetical protein V3U72_01230 [Candidatus Aenigmarchaeota archaeon]